jgi:hypothetical protein
MLPINVSRSVSSPRPPTLTRSPNPEMRSRLRAEPPHARCVTRRFAGMPAGADRLHLRW